MFHGGVSGCECGVIVLFEDHRYFFVEGTPDGFFRSLFDRTKLPQIARDPIGSMVRYPIRATSAAGAVEEATQFLKSRKEPFD
jgi:hypothetical protein